MALSVALQTQRLSRDPDLFHDTTDAVARSGIGTAGCWTRPDTQGILEQARRSARYSQVEIDALAFDGPRAR